MPKVIKTGREAAKAVADKLRVETTQEQVVNEREEKEIIDSLVRVEDSKSTLSVRNTMNIKGLEDVPTSMMPIPYYKLVQPSSTNIELADGSEAPAGSIYMNDTKTATQKLRFCLLRAKRQKQEFTDDDGNQGFVVKMGLLGMNLDLTTPFILSLSKSSFGSFGWLMKQLNDLDAQFAWSHAINATFERMESQVMVKGRMQTVKYYVAKFEVEKELMDKNMVELMNNAYVEFGGGLDREKDNETSNNKSEVS